MSKSAANRVQYAYGPSFGVVSRERRIDSCEIECIGGILVHFLLIISVSHRKWHSENWKFMFDSAANEVIKITSFACTHDITAYNSRLHATAAKIVPEHDEPRKKLAHWLKVACYAFIKYSYSHFFFVLFHMVVVLLTFDKLYRLTSSPSRSLAYWAISVSKSIDLFFFTSFHRNIIFLSVQQRQPKLSQFISLNFELTRYENE